MTDVVAALIWRNNRFLACQRPANKSRALLWEFVGGKVEPGETKPQALIRECREELGIEVGVGEMFMEVIHEYPDITVRLTLFNAWILAGEPQLLEHNDLLWLTTAQIPDYSFCPADRDILQALQTIDTRLQAQLFSFRDEGYKRFILKLTPGLDPSSVLGVRVPAIRSIAKRLSLRDLGPLPHRYYEENLLHAISISAIQDAEATIHALDEFLPHVNNWAICDTLSPKAFQNRPAQAEDAVARWFSSDHPYTVRFAIGVRMKYYLDDGFSEQHFSHIRNACCEEYYINMMVAWYFATALAKRFEQTLEWLRANPLPKWTMQKTLQKARESFRLSAAQKNILNELKESII